MTLDEIEAQRVLKAYVKTPAWITAAREQSNKLFALIHGDNFIDLLINKIEYIESPNKAAARKRYSRDIIHYFERILRPNANIYSANGGSISLNIDSESDKEALLSTMSRTKDGKSLREWLKTFWMPLYHSDPNGVIFIEYTTKDNKIDCWPTYKQIDVIQSYKPKGQLVEWILFKPVKEVINGKQVMTIRLVDDTLDRTYLVNGDKFTLLENDGIKDRSFEHPFGQVPALVNSDIEDFRGNTRLSPINSIIGVSEEFARDQSQKTLYKIRMGLPTEWKIGDQCITCHGKGKVDDSNCKECDGQGYYMSKDITDIKIIAAPEGDEKAINGNDTGGFIVPPSDPLIQFREELRIAIEDAFSTHWGTMAGFASKVVKTATEIFYDTQPMTDKLNDIGDIAEFMENQIVEWYANAVIPTKQKDKHIASIHYGRRYIIDPPDVILEKYEKAKREGDNNVILDRLYNEYLTARFRRDPEFLRIMLLKSSIDPYLHSSLEQVEKAFGVIEVQKKILFQKWWNILTAKDKENTSEKLDEQFDKWFEDQQPEEANAETLAAQAELRGSVGGATNVKDLITSVSLGQVPKESAIVILIELFGFKDDVAKRMIGDPTVITTPTTTGAGE